MTILISGTISLISDEVMANSGIFTAFVILLAIIIVSDSMYTVKENEYAFCTFALYRSIKVGKLPSSAFFIFSSIIKILHMSNIISLFTVI
jgi:hypothetical protein